MLDDTTSFIGRFQSLRPQPNANAGGAPALNSVGASHFTGRFDNFATDLSTNWG